MILNKNNDTFTYQGVVYRIGAQIVGNEQSEYQGLFGTIIEIRDGKDTETGKGIADIYCAFEAPVLPCEVKELEERFSALHQEPKTIDNIISDPVIVAPEMICPLDDLKECRRHPIVYVLKEDWAVDGDYDNSSDVYTDFHDAKRLLVQKLKEKMAIGCIPRWKNREGFVENSTPDSYECYLEGEYAENHFSISITTQELCASDRFISEIAEFYKASCQLEDFASQVSGWDEVDQLTDEQYERMIHDPRFPEKFQNALSKNDAYWESYWETVSEVAHELVKEYLEKPDCYTPEADKPYPLCVGNGTEKCRECCLWAELEPDME